MENKPPNGTGLQGKAILLVNTGSIKKRIILQQLKKLGLFIIVLNKEKNWAQSYADHWIFADTTNAKESIQAIRDFIKDGSNRKIDGVLTFWEDDVLLTSKIIDTFNFIGIPFSVAQKIRNKFLFRKFCEEHGIRAPHYLLLKSRDDCTAAIEQCSFPLVIKPVYGASSAYVIKVQTPDELITTYDYIRRNMSVETESALSNGLDILVEEYIDGEEVDIDILLQNGKIKFYSLTDNFQTREPFFVETGDAIPSSLPPPDQRALVECAEETLEKLGIQNGCVHFEAKSTRSGPVPIEINLRMGGDQVYSYVKGVWGVDLIEQAARIACGMYMKSIPSFGQPLKYMVGRYFLSEDSGILSRLDISDTIKKDPRVEDLALYKKVGDPVLVPPEGYEYLGWITVSGDNPIDAQDNLLAIMKQVHYEVAKFNRDSAIGRTSRKTRFAAASITKDLLLRAAKRETMKRLSREDIHNVQIGILHNTPNELLGASNQELSPTAHALEETLSQRGYTVRIFDCSTLQTTCSALLASDVNLILNVRARIAQSRSLELHTAALLDMLDIPYAGPDPLALGVCADAIHTKKLLNYHGIPTPRWDYAYADTDPINEDLHFPLIVKPALNDDTRDPIAPTVVSDPDTLKVQISAIVARELPVCIEEYIDGDEYHVIILGNDTDTRVLPLTRIIFSPHPDVPWPLYSHVMNTPERIDNASTIIHRPPKNISKKLESLITEIALDAYNILECRDYAHIKIRVDKDQNPTVIRVNPAPLLHPDGCLAHSALLLDMQYGDLVEEIIRVALDRYKE